MSHGLVESLGMQHFKYKEGATSKEDTQLYYDGYDRIYDTLEVEQNLDDAADIVKPILEKEFSEGASLCSHKITRAIGKYLAETFEESGILRQAYLKNVPVFIPAFTDSELGLDFGIYLKEFARDGKKPYTYDAYLDLEKYTKLIAGKETLGIFTIGGGVPRNWAQQVGPYLDMIGRKLHGKEILRRFKYGVRICPEPVNWGGLSGCTYSEGISWGKFVPPHEGGRFAEVLEDATVAWPLLLKGVIQRIEKNKTQG